MRTPSSPSRAVTTNLLRSRSARATIAVAVLVGVAGAGIASVLLLARDGGSGPVAIAAAGLAALVGLLTGILLAQSQQSRVLEAAEAARRLADGDFSERLHPNLSGRGDPLSSLAESLDHLRDQLRTIGSSAAEDRSVLASVLTRMDDGILILARDESVEFANPAAERILGLIDRSPSRRSLVATLRDHQLVRSVRARLASTGPSAIESGLYDLGSGRRHLRVQATSLEGRRGLVVLQDITEIRRADTIRRDFVANVSHDLRTPLASLKALVETLRDGALEDPPAAQEFLRRMEIELDDLTQLVLELLELSRIESGRVAFAIEPIDVAELLAQATDRLRPQADRAGLVLSVDPAPAASSVRGDSGRIRQALINLIHNAIKFTPPGGTIGVMSDLGRQTPSGIVLLPRDEPSPHATHVVMSVVDSGVGIELEEQSRIFERFYRADRARSGGGTGLGLAIVKHVAEMQGGHVWVESRPGAGSSFRLALPLDRKQVSDSLDS